MAVFNSSYKSRSSIIYQYKHESRVNFISRIGKVGFVFTPRHMREAVSVALISYWLSASGHVSVLFHNWGVPSFSIKDIGSTNNTTCTNLFRNKGTLNFTTTKKINTADHIDLIISGFIIFNLCKWSPMNVIAVYF